MIYEIESLKISTVFRLIIIKFGIPAVHHELVDGPRTSRGRGLVVPCVDLSYYFTVCKL